MKYVYKIATPIGIGYIAFGEFIPKDGRINKYHCWWNGCGIGGTSRFIGIAKEYLFDHIKDRLTRRIKEHNRETFNIRLFLNEYFGG